MDHGRDDGAIPTGRVRRAAPVAGLAARTAGEAVVVALRRKATGADVTVDHERAAERYAELLGRSRGALMKAGQAMSFMAMGPAVPAEMRHAYQTALGRLRDDAPAMAPHLARRILEEELGATVEQRFVEFDPDPFAAASIGQVHAARLPDGRKVAVKIQYPGVAAAIDDDLKNHELLSTFFGLMLGISPFRMRLDQRAVAREVAAEIRKELDYRLEAVNQRAFAEIYRGHPFIRVPAVIDELSTGRVLTQELAEGRAWREALEADHDLRVSWAEAIHRFAYGSVDSFHVFNADPHPGNYVFHDDGGVTFLDFGCVKRLRAERVNANTRILQACLRGDVEGTWRASLQAGLWEPTDPVAPDDVYAYWREPFELYWGAQPFTVTPESVAAFIQRRYLPNGASAKAVKSVRGGPDDYMMLGRMDIGAMSLIAELRVAHEWGSLADEFFENAPPVTEMGTIHLEWLRAHPTAIRHAEGGRGHGIRRDAEGVRG